MPLFMLSQMFKIQIVTMRRQERESLSTTEDSVSQGKRTPKPTPESKMRRSKKL
jgi:hypothetical protein